MPVTQRDLALVSGEKQTPAVEVWMQRQRKQYQYTPEMIAPMFGFKDGSERAIDRVIAPTVCFEPEQSAITTSSARVLRANTQAHQYRGVDLPIAQPLEGSRSPPNLDATSTVGMHRSGSHSPTRFNSHGKSARELRWRMHVNRAASGALGQTDKVTAIPAPDARRLTGQQMNMTMNAGHYTGTVMGMASGDMEDGGEAGGGGGAEADIGFSIGHGMRSFDETASLSMMGSATLGGGGANETTTGMNMGRRRGVSQKELAAQKAQHAANFRR